MGNAELTNLSRSGAFLRLPPQRVQPGDRLELVMTTQAQGRVVHMLRRTAIVVRCASAGVGIAFLRPTSPWRRDDKL